MSHISASAQRARRRAPTACRPCRKQRKKCIHNGLEPCQSCVESNMADECSYVERGEQNVDRQFRHPRMRRADRVSRNGGINLPRGLARGPGAMADQPYFLETSRALLPDVNTIMVGLDAFFRKFNQLGFLPGDQFAHKVREDVNSVSAFLVCSILAVSARFARPLRDRYGGGVNAIAELTDRAEHAARLEIFEEVATLERCQAFLLLSIAQQGSGRVRSSHHSAGIALSIAASLGLHREETYVRMTGAPLHQPRTIVESARRTFWYVYCLNNSIGGPERPITLPAQEISTCPLQDEASFYGQPSLTSNPQEARLAGTPQNRVHNIKPPSLAAYLQILDLWGAVARLASCKETRGESARSRKSIAEVLRRLDEWDHSRPQNQAFEASLLAIYRGQSFDLAYLDINATFRLCHIALRKAYLNDMVQQPSTASQIPDDEVEMYRGVMKDLFVQVRHLFQILDSRFEYGSMEDKVGSALTCFTLYTVGVMATYLYKCPQIDIFTGPHSHNEHDRKRDEGLRMYTKVSYLLRSCQDVWPVAGYWHADLESWHHAFHTSVIRARVDAVLARSRNYTKLSPRHQQAHVDLQQRKQLDEAARLAPLQNTHGGMNTNPLSLPPLKKDIYNPLSHGLPSLPSPPSTRPANPVPPGTPKHFQDRASYSHNPKHLQVVLDHRPHNPAQQSPRPSNGPQAATPPQYQSRLHDPLQSFMSSQCSNDQKSPSSGSSPKRGFSSNNRLTASSSTPNRAHSQNAMATTTGLSKPVFGLSNSYSNHSDDERSEFGLQDGFERNLEVFLQTGAIWAASISAHTPSPHHQGAAGTTLSTGRDEQAGYRYGLVIPPGSGTTMTAPASAHGGVYSNFGQLARPLSGSPLSGSPSSTSYGYREERGSIGTVDTHISTS